MTLRIAFFVAILIFLRALSLFTLTVAIERESSEGVLEPVLGGSVIKVEVEVVVVKRVEVERQGGVSGPVCMGLRVGED